MRSKQDVEKRREKVHACAQHLLELRGKRPRVAMFLGTGHNEFSNQLEGKKVVLTEEISEFPAGVESSTLVMGSYAGVEIVLTDAPMAPYLGISGEELAFPVRVLRAMGAEFLLLTAAAAAVKPLSNPGDLAVVEDHLNFTSINPLLGQNDELLGPRFPDMTEPYDNELAKMAIEVAAEAGFPIHSGVFAAIQGPSLPTKAEYRFLRQAGADFVGMSTVPEILAAVHAGFRNLALLGITQSVNLAVQRAIDLEHMVDAADLAAPRMGSLLSGLIEKIATL